MTDVPEGALRLAERLIRMAEGCSLRPYLDIAGVPTIGVGCCRLNGKPVTMRTPAITEAEADQALGFELSRTEALLEGVVHIHLSAGEWAACASLAYNIGGGAFAGSTLLRMVNQARMDEAEAQFERWNLAGGKPSAGLTRRRALERTVFETGGLPLTLPAPAAELHSVSVRAHAETADDLNARQLAELGLTHT